MNLSDEVRNGPSEQMLGAGQRSSLMKRTPYIDVQRIVDGKNEITL